MYPALEPGRERGKAGVSRLVDQKFQDRAKCRRLERVLTDDANFDGPGREHSDQAADVEFVPHAFMQELSERRSWGGIARDLRGQHLDHKLAFVIVEDGHGLLGGP